MKERPIIFSAPMIYALLAGTKTQTRRPYKVRKHPDIGCEMAACELVLEQQHVIDRICPYGQPGDRLWVRETWADDVEAQWEPQKRGTFYRADDDAEECRSDCVAAGIPFVWRPSIHMHRWRSRITLEITRVRVERLQEITEADALAEGILKLNDGYALTKRGEHYHTTDPRRSFLSLWTYINGRDSWAANPWVWVVEFKRIAL